MTGTGSRRPVDAATALERQVRMLRTAMGPVIAAALEDPQVVEVMLNPDGSLWLDRLEGGRKPTGVSLSASDGERIIRLVASHLRLEVHAGAPIVSAELPVTGERFEGVLPPVARAPTFALRKPAVVVPLVRCVAEGVMSQAQADVLRNAVLERKNVLIAGGTSTGKTMLVNTLLQVVAEARDRVFLLEDTAELECLSNDHVPLRTKPGVATMAQLVHSVLRLSPDRIVVGEVRGAEALDLLKAWGTGHPGGLATIHAGSAAGALVRLEQLVQEAVVTVSRTMIAEAVDVVVYLEGRGKARRVTEIVRVEGIDGDGYLVEPVH